MSNEWPALSRAHVFRVYRRLAKHRPAAAKLSIGTGEGAKRIETLWNAQYSHDPIEVVRQRCVNDKMKKSAEHVNCSIPGLVKNYAYKPFAEYKDVVRITSTSTDMEIRESMSVVLNLLNRNGTIAPCGNVFGTNATDRRAQLFAALRGHPEDITIAYSGHANHPDALLIYKHAKQFGQRVHLSSTSNTDGLSYTGEGFRKLLASPHERIDELMFICSSVKGAASQLLHDFITQEVAKPFVLYATQATLVNDDGTVDHANTDKVSRTFYKSWETLPIEGIGDADLKTHDNTWEKIRLRRHPV